MPHYERQSRERHIAYCHQIRDYSVYASTGCLNYDAQPRHCHGHQLGHSWTAREVGHVHHVGPVTKPIRMLDNLVDPVTGGLLQTEPRAVSDELPVRPACWTRHFMDNASVEGHFRIDVPLTRAGRFPTRLRLFGRPVISQGGKQRANRWACAYSLHDCLRGCLSHDPYLAAYSPHALDMKTLRRTINASTMRMLNFSAAVGSSRLQTTLLLVLRLLRGLIASRLPIALTLWDRP